MKFEGIFNWHGEVTELYRHANSVSQATSFMHQQLAQKYGVTAGRIRQYFSGQNDNCRIEKV